MKNPFDYFRMIRILESRNAATDTENFPKFGKLLNFETLTFEEKRFGNPWKKLWWNEMSQREIEGTEI